VAFTSRQVHALLVRYRAKLGARRVGLGGWPAPTPYAWRVKTRRGRPAPAGRDRVRASRQLAAAQAYVLLVAPDVEET
jgi:hypothetical protein